MKSPFEKGLLLIFLTDFWFLLTHLGVGFSNLLFFSNLCVSQIFFL